jgi:hypothetical protein
LIPAATRRFALANNGITITETAATMMPEILRSGVSRRISAEPDSHVMYRASARKHYPTIRKVVRSTASSKSPLRYLCR